MDALLDRIAGPGGGSAVAADHSVWRIDSLRRQRTAEPAERDELALVRLVPEGPIPAWQAGDVVEIQIGEARREYTIASLPEEGALALVVRPAVHPDGTWGVGTAALTTPQAVGRRLRLRIRSNPHLHCPPPDRPMLLIGAGSGIAGLRAQLADRVRQGSGANWVAYGDRSPARSDGPQTDLRLWYEAGWIERLDLAFSRTGTDPCRVPDRLRAQEPALRAWLAREPVIYVCGSAAGIGASFHVLLSDLIGRERLEEMAARGDYRRDVY